MANGKHPRRLTTPVAARIVRSSPLSIQPCLFIDARSSCIASSSSSVPRIIPPYFGTRPALRLVIKIEPYGPVGRYSSRQRRLSAESMTKSQETSVIQHISKNLERLILKGSSYRLH